MDDDAEVESNYFNDIMKIINCNSSLCIGCGVIKNFEDGKYFSRHIKNKIENINYNNFDRCLSSAIFFKKDVVKKIDYFDEMFGVGAYYGASEESDFIIRALGLNLKVKAFPHPIVFHPKFDVDNLSYSNLRKKGFTYGLGRGALYKKYVSIKPFWSILNLLKSLLVSMSGILLNILKLNSRGVYWYISNLLGRIYGFYKYSIK